MYIEHVATNHSTVYFSYKCVYMNLAASATCVYGHRCSVYMYLFSGVGVVCVGVVGVV